MNQSHVESTTVLVRDLTVRFGDFTAVRKIGFEVKAGEIFGFLGANGAGKTTTIRVLCGLLKPTEGEVFVAGQDVRQDPMAVKKRVGYMSQRFTLYNDLTINENLYFAAQLRKIPQDEFKKRSEELLSFIGFRRERDSLVKDLPGGIKQQVSLIAAMLHNPQVVFLDEPTAGVTPAYRARFWELIKSVAKGGTTVFVTTHYMDEAEQCERIALMRDGELIALDTPSRLKQQSFPKGLIELEPHEHFTSEDISRLHAAGVFSLLEPYGMRYHAEISDSKKWDQIQSQFKGRFTTREIHPSLEDVFIRLVEGDKS